MSEKIKISYILTTYNKYDYLKVTLPYILSQLQEDEELILVDGSSKDNTVPFIKEQTSQKTNITFLSEPDKGESHGLNKALFLCKGEIIKPLTDDDAFSFYAARKAAAHMLSSDFDIMGFDGFGLSLFHESCDFSISTFKANFDVHKREHSPFFFCGLSYLIKKDSLPLLGLFSLDYKMVDLEYSFRISSGKGKIGWSNLFMFTNIYNANSNTLVFNKRLEAESIELHKKYASGKKALSVYLRFKLQRILEFKNRLLKKDSYGKTNKLSFEEGFKKSVELLEKENLAIDKILFYT